MTSRFGVRQHLLALATVALPSIVLLATTSTSSPAAPARSTPLFSLCACEASYTLGGTAGACGCDWSFVNVVVEEGQCSPEPWCSQLTFCKVTGNVQFEMSPINPPPECSGAALPVAVTAPCRGQGTNTVFCPGGSSGIKITVHCQQCTPA